MFSDLDETIRQLLIRDVPLDLSEVDVSFEAPDREWSGRLSRPAINCFLYDVQENEDLREAGWEKRVGNGTATRRKPLLWFDAAYQVTAWARAPEDEHRLLWRVLAALTRHSTLPRDLAHGSIKEQPFPIPTQLARPDQKVRASAADLWQALDNRIRPSVTYVVSLALDPQVVFTSPLVLTRTVRLEHLHGGNGHPRSEPLQLGSRQRERGGSQPALAPTNFDSEV